MEPAAAEATSLREISCRTCAARVVVEPHHLTARCPYCDSPAVIERPPAPDRPLPRFAIGFAIDKPGAAQRLHRWLRSRGPLAHAGLRHAALHEVRGVYVPAWLYGAVGETTYQASIGENYTTTETYVTTDSKGRPTVRTRTVVRTEWRPLSGRHEIYVTDVLVSASQGVHNDELERVEPYDLRALRRYQPELVAGWIAEEPTRGREACRRLAHDESVGKIARGLPAFMPGDSHRNLTFRTDLKDEVIDLVLLPLWVFAVRYDPEQPPARILVNGQTGEVAGRVPLSRARVVGAVALAVLLVLAVVLLIAWGVR